MKRMVVSYVLSLSLVVAGMSGMAAGTKDDAERMVKKAIQFMKDNGKEKALEAISDPKGQFVKEDVYVIVYDMSAKCLAHGANAKLIGKNLIDMKDPDGFEYNKARVELAKSKGSGWIDYKFTNPTTKKVEPKTCYVEKFEDMIFSAGAYKQ